MLLKSSAHLTAFLYGSIGRYLLGCYTLPGFGSLHASMAHVMLCIADMGLLRCRRYGRKVTMLTAGICFMVGAVLTAAAYHLPQLVIGRVVLGFGVGELLFKTDFGV